MARELKIFRCLGILIIIILCVGFTVKEFQNDTFYTIKIGQLIVNNGIDMLDHFSFHDLAYSYPHWLYDVFIYEIYNFSGLIGIYISTIILYCMLILSIYLVNFKLVKNEFVAFLVSLLSLFLLRSSVTARAQLVSTILFVWEVYFIEMFIKTKHKRYVVSLIIISLLIANIHVAVWPFYFVVYLPYLVEQFFIWLPNNKFIQFLKKKKVKFGFNSFNGKIITCNNKNIKYLLVIMLLGLLMGFLTPIGEVPFTYFIRTMLGNSQSYILEHKPLVLASNPVFMMLMVLFILLLMFTGTKIKLHDLFMLSGLTLMTFMSSRHILLLVSVGSVACARLLVSFFECEDDNSIFQIVNTVTKVPVMLLLILLVICYSFDCYEESNKVGYINEKLYPVEASNYIINNLDLDQIRIFNDYNYGSYLMYRNIPVFIDSRADLYLPEFNKGVTIFDDYIDIEYNYQEVFKKYEITHVLVNNNSLLNNILNLDINYNKIYEDDYFILYVRLGL